jgi:pectate lyase
MRRGVSFLRVWCVALFWTVHAPQFLHAQAPQTILLTSPRASVGLPATFQRFGGFITTGGDSDLVFRGVGRRVSGVGIIRGAVQFRLRSPRFVRSISVTVLDEGSITLWDHSGEANTKVWSVAAGETQELMTGFSERSRWFRIESSARIIIHAVTLASSFSPGPDPTVVPTVVPSPPPPHVTEMPTALPTPEVTQTPQVTVAPCPGFSIFGFGRETTGGCGGEEYVVSRLDDPAVPVPGTLRFGVQNMSSARTIRFSVFGTIRLTRDLIVRSGDLTIDGSTAPGEGVQITGATLSINASNVILRYLRVLVGPASPNPSQADGVRIHGDRGAYVERIVLDHCTVMWATDENISITDLARNITVQWSIVAEGLFRSTHREGAHSMGALFHQDATRMTFHRNLFAHHNYRNPQVASRGVLEWINNIVYDTGSAAGILQTQNAADRNFVDAIGNVNKLGPSSDHAGSRFRYSWREGLTVGVSSLFVRDNLDWNRTNNQSDQRLVVAPALWKWITGQRHVTTSDVPIASPTDAYETVITEAGARLPCPSESERRIARETREGTGSFIDHPNERGGFPELSSVCR